MNEVVIVEYFSVTEVSPRSIAPYLNHERFRDKGVSKLLINLIQIISNMLSNGVEKAVILKCVEELESFYETIGFTEIHKGSKWLQIEEVIDHYDLMEATIPLKTYILKPDATIDHKTKTFINHVGQSIEDVDLTEGYEASIVPDIIEIFESQKTYD